MPLPFPPSSASSVVSAAAGSAGGGTVFRADASAAIGTGHVMRCLTLADALRKTGESALFLCRPHEGHLMALIAQRGHCVKALPPLAPSTAVRPDGAGLAHAHWLGTDQATDAGDCLAALAAEGMARPAWIVVDHYALDAVWESRMRPAAGRLMAIDDLADRRHACDLLLDQNLGRRAQDYAGLVPERAGVLIGPRHALLRPEFAALRAESLARRARPALRRLLIALGGVDRENHTCAVLDALDAVRSLPDDLEILVVMGPQAPWLDAVRARAAALSRPVRVLAGVSDMARLMARSDLAIGAAGGTAWERCCLGLPTIQMVLAANQAAGAAALEAAGAAVMAASAQDAAALLRDWIAQGRAAEMIGRIGAAAARITAGDGACLVAREMEGLHV